VEFRRVLDHHHVPPLKSSITELRNRFGSVFEQAPLVCPIDPGARDYPGAVARADLMLEGVNNRVERRPIHQPFFH
jgi:hypothetical protein